MSDDDDQPNTICWMCTQNIETFHKFYEKVFIYFINYSSNYYRTKLIKFIFNRLMKFNWIH